MSDKDHKILRFSSKTDTFLKICKGNRGGRAKKVVPIVVVVVVVPFFFIHFFSFPTQFPSDEKSSASGERSSVFGLASLGIIFWEILAHPNYFLLRSVMPCKVRRPRDELYIRQGKIDIISTWRLNNNCFLLFLR